ncbi:MAG: MATE family efflux transporter [Phycisphaerales bacterium]|nr:MATE family efflux transporter [Phycisphaerales bacterium]
MNPALPAEHARGPTVELLILALPIILMMVSRMLIGFIDFVMVSKLGTAAQAAISPATLLVWTVACLGNGVATAVQTFVAQTDGRGRPEQAGAYAWQSIYVALAYSILQLPIVLTVPQWFGPIAAIGRHTPEVAALQIEYVQIALWSVPLVIICTGLDGFFSGIRRPWLTFVAVLVSVLVNVFGNWVLIFGHLGFPALGIAGAALATIIAWFARLVVLASAMFLQEFHERFRTRGALAFDWHKTVELIRIGAPTALGWLVDIGAWAVFILLIIPRYGQEVLAATNIGIQYMHLSFMPAVGIALALTSQVGHAIGAGQPELALRRASIAFRVTGVYMGLVGLLMLLAGGPLTGLLAAGGDPAVISAGRLILVWCAIFQVFDAMAITYINALRGAGDTRWPAIVMGLCCWFIFILGGLGVAWWVPQLGLNGPWMTCSLYIIVLGLLVRLRWQRGAWRHIRIFRDGAHGATVAPTESTPTGAAPALAAGSDER